MTKVVGVRFKDTGKTYYFDPQGIENITSPTKKAADIIQRKIPLLVIIFISSLHPQDNCRYEHPKP